MLLNDLLRLYIGLFSLIFVANHSYPFIPIFEIFLFPD